MTPYYPLEATPGVDPAPNVATPDEIRQAESLLHRLESRLLKPPLDGGAHVPSTDSPPPAST
jgi:hypothetical protein